MCNAREVKNPPLVDDPPFRFHETLWLPELTLPIAEMIITSISSYKCSKVETQFNTEKDLRHTSVDIQGLVACTVRSHGSWNMHGFVLF